MKLWRPFVSSTSDVIKSVTFCLSSYNLIHFPHPERQFSHPAHSAAILTLSCPHCTLLNVHTAHSWMSIRLHHLCHLYTTSFFPATMLWVSKYFTFSSPGIIWKIFFVSLCYGKLSVLGKLETRMEKHTLVNTNSKFLLVCFESGGEKKSKCIFWAYLSLI